MPDAYFVYVIRNPAGILYTGIAKDVDARCERHNTGDGARFTRGRGPWIVVHVEGPLTRGDALRRECAIKSDRRFKSDLKAKINPPLCR
jgi:putative endonuclease